MDTHELRESDKFWPTLASNRYSIDTDYNLLKNSYAPKFVMGDQYVIIWYHKGHFIHFFDLQGEKYYGGIYNPDPILRLEFNQWFITCISYLSIYTWDSKSFKKNSQIKFKRQIITSTVHLLDDDTVFLVNGEHRPCLLNLFSGEMYFQFELPKKYNRFIYDNQRGSIYLRNANQGHTAEDRNNSLFVSRLYCKNGQIETCAQHVHAVSFFQLQQDLGLLITGDHEVIKVWDTKTFDVLKTIRHKNYGYCSIYKHFLVVTFSHGFFFHDLEGLENMGREPIYLQSSGRFIPGANDSGFIIEQASDVLNLKELDSNFAVRNVYTLKKHADIPNFAFSDQFLCCYGKELLQCNIFSILPNYKHIFETYYNQTTIEVINDNIVAVSYSQNSYCIRLFDHDLTLKNRIEWTHGQFGSNKSLFHRSNIDKSSVNIVYGINDKNNLMTVESFHTYKIDSGKIELVNKFDINMISCKNVNLLSDLLIAYIPGNRSHSSINIYKIEIDGKINLFNKISVKTDFLQDWHIFGSSNLLITSNSHSMSFYTNFGLVDFKTGNETVADLRLLPDKVLFVSISDDDSNGYSRYSSYEIKYFDLNSKTIVNLAKIKFESYGLAAIYIGSNRIILKSDTLHILDSDDSFCTIKEHYIVKHDFENGDYTGPYSKNPSKLFSHCEKSGLLFVKRYGIGQIRIDSINIMRIDKENITHLATFHSGTDGFIWTIPPEEGEKNTYFYTNNTDYIHVIEDVNGEKRILQPDDPRRAEHLKIYNSQRHVSTRINDLEKYRKLMQVNRAAEIDTNLSIRLLDSGI